MIVWYSKTYIILIMILSIKDSFQKKLLNQIIQLYNIIKKTEKFQTTFIYRVVLNGAFLHVQMW